MRRLIIALLLAVACTAESPAQPDGSAESDPPNTSYRPAFVGQTRAPNAPSGVTLRVETIATGLANPWALEFLPDGRLLVTEREGRMRVITRQGVKSNPIAGLPPVVARGQGGLLDVALSPSFAADRLIYWSYSEPRGGGRNGTSVARGRLSEDTSRVADVQVIFRQAPAWNSEYHFGSRLVWDRQGHLFVTMGERAHNDARGLAQSLDGLLGKVVRIHADGTVPADNPFVSRAGARPEIWSYGHRNVQGATLHPQTGALWTIEHGPRGGDELNAPKPGRNYGWPIITYGIEYSGQRMGRGETARAGMEQPVYYWDPVIAPGGMTFYRGALLPWRGDLIIAALRGGLVRLRLNGERVIGEERLLSNEGRFRDVKEAPDGALWTVTDESDGHVLRLTPQRS